MSKNLSRGVERGKLPEYPPRDQETKDIFAKVDRQIDQELFDVMKAAKINPQERIPADFYNIPQNKDRLQYTVFSELKNRVYSNEMLTKMKEKYQTFQFEKSDKNLADIYKRFFGQVVKPVVLTYNLKPKVNELLADKIDLRQNQNVVESTIMNEVEKDLKGQRTIHDIRSLANQILIKTVSTDLPRQKTISELQLPKKSDGLGRTPQMKLAAEKFKKGEITPAEFSQYVRLEEAAKIIKSGGHIDNWDEVKQAGESVIEKIAGKKMKQSDEIDTYTERYEKIADLLDSGKINFDEYEFLKDNLFKIRDGNPVSDEDQQRIQELENR